MLCHGTRDHVHSVMVYACALTMSADAHLTASPFSRRVTYYWLTLRLQEVTCAFLAVMMTLTATVTVRAAQ